MCGYSGFVVYWKSYVAPNWRNGSLDSLRFLVTPPASLHLTLLSPHRIPNYIRWASEHTVYIEFINAWYPVYIQIKQLSNHHNFIHHHFFPSVSDSQACFLKIWACNDTLGKSLAGRTLEEPCYSEPHPSALLQSMTTSRELHLQNLCTTLIPFIL